MTSTPGATTPPSIDATNTDNALRFHHPPLTSRHRLIRPLVPPRIIPLPRYIKLIHNIMDSSHLAHQGVSHEHHDSLAKEEPTAESLQAAIEELEEQLDEQNGVLHNWWVYFTEENAVISLFVPANWSAPDQSKKRAITLLAQVSVRRTACHALCHALTSRHVTSRHVTSRHTTSHHNTPIQGHHLPLCPDHGD